MHCVLVVHDIVCVHVLYARSESYSSADGAQILMVMYCLLVDKLL